MNIILQGYGGGAKLVTQGYSSASSGPQRPGGKVVKVKVHSPGAQVATVYQPKRSKGNGAGY